MSDEPPKPPALSALGSGATLAGGRQGDTTAGRQSGVTDGAIAAGMPTDAPPTLAAPAAPTAPTLPTLAGPAVPSLPNAPNVPTFNLSGPTQQDKTGSDFPAIPTLPGLGPSQGAPPTMPTLSGAATLPTLGGADAMEARRRAAAAIAQRNGRQSTFLTTTAGRPARTTPATLASPTPATTRRTYG